MSLGQTEKAEQRINEFENKNINPSFSLYVKGSLQLALRDYQGTKESFKERPLLHGQDSGFDLPSIQTLIITGQYKEAFTLYENSIPELKNKDLVITRKNIYVTANYSRLRKEQVNGYSW